MLLAQDDVTVVESKDYIEAPKTNGYRSLHLLLEVPVFTSRDVQQIPVEVQIRTSAMDFWASLEHKIFYKYSGEVHPTLRLATSSPRNCSGPGHLPGTQTGVGRRTSPDNDDHDPRRAGIQPDASSARTLFEWSARSSPGPATDLKSSDGSRPISSWG